MAKPIIIPIWYLIIFLIPLIRSVEYKFVWISIKKRFPLSKIDFSIDEFLNEYSTYYQGLDTKQKEFFIYRIAKFIRSKIFISEGNLKEVSMEMKILIASKAVQITFGLPNIYLSTFHTIYVYPEGYLSESGRMHKGEVSENGTISLSWKHFLEGIQDPEDGINLGLHEMTHALHIENHRKTGFYLFIPARYLAELKSNYKYYKDYIVENDVIIRPYAGTNFHEFFAVCVELFFEQPKELYEFDSELFHLMEKILNQKILIN